MKVWAEVVEEHGPDATAGQVKKVVAEVVPAKHRPRKKKQLAEVVPLPTAYRPATPPAECEPDPDVFDLPASSVNVETGEVISTADQDAYDRLTRFLGGIATSLPQFADFPMRQAVDKMPTEEKSVWIDVIQRTRQTLMKIEQEIGEDDR